MNIHKNTKTRSGFTLIELLTVIAIIGILAGILIPTIGVVRKSASKATSSSNLRQIGLAYNVYANSGPRLRSVANGAWAPNSTQANNMQGWAQVLAQFGGLNEAAVYFINSASDVAVLTPAQFPQIILDNTNVATTPWANAAGAISYEAIVAVNPNSPSTTTPLIWTKDIDEATSVWNATSPWEGEGGHICFLDAHVAFYNTLADELVDETGAKVSTINDALNIGGTGVTTVVVNP